MPERRGVLALIGGIAGIVGPAAALSLVFYSVSISSWFTWQGNALSDLGVNTAAVYFNSGLIFEGILNVVFAAGIWSAMKWTGLRNLAGPLLGLSGASLGFVGVFTENSGSLHGDFALGFFILFPVSILVTALIIGGRSRPYSVISAVMAVAALVAIFLTPHRAGALAIPEILEALILSAWSVATGAFMVLRGTLPGGLQSASGTGK